MGRQERFVTVHESILTTTQTDVLKVIGPFARSQGFYLAGGTAVALRFGHRRSEDFDWFVSSLPNPDLLLSDLKAQGLPLEDTRIERGTVLSRIKGVKVSFLEYRYPLLELLESWPEYDTDLASVRD